MESIQLNGKYKIDKGTVLKDPLATILNANYNYQNMNVVLIVEYSNTQYKHIRELDPYPILTTDGLTKSQIKQILNQSMIEKEVKEPTKQ